MTAASVTETSDARLKRNIETISHRASDILKLNGVSYELMGKPTEGEPGDSESAWANATAFNHGTHFGFVAQELREVFPELVSEDAEGWLSVRYAAFAPLLVEFVKEHDRSVQELSRDNQRLRAQVDHLNELVAQQNQRLDSLEESLSKLLPTLPVALS